MEDQGIEISDKELELIASAQIGMTDGILNARELSGYDYTYEEAARFSIRFFMRQLGIDEETILAYTERGKELFDALPIDNRYYEDFAYDDRYVKKVDEG